MDGFILCSGCPRERPLTEAFSSANSNLNTRLMSPPTTPQKSLQAALLNADWIEFRTLPGGSYDFIWTQQGEQRCYLLRLAIEEFKLGEEVDAPLRFARETVNPSAQGEASFREVARQFWIACLVELDLAWERDSLWNFVKFIEVGGRSVISGMAFAELAMLRSDVIPRADGCSTG